MSATLIDSVGLYGTNGYSPNADFVTVPTWPTYPTTWSYHICNCSSEMSLSDLMNKLKEKLDREAADKESAKQLIASLKKFIS